jgi:hypothetical protein
MPLARPVISVGGGASSAGPLNARREDNAVSQAHESRLP